MPNRSLLIVFMVAVSLVLAGTAYAANTLKWDDLAPPWDETRNPMNELTQDQQDNVYTLFYGSSFGDPKLKRNKEEQEAYDALKASGLDPEAFFAKIKKLRKEQDRRDKTLVFDLDKKVIKLPGYVLPLDFEGTQVKSFLLVPFVGACIHVPPPPPNQIVHVEPEKAFTSDRLWAPVWVTGEITVGNGKKSLTLVDGSNEVNYGYSLRATQIEPFKE